MVNNAPCKYRLFSFKTYIQIKKCLLRACKALETDAAKLDEEYNRLTDVMAEGERDEFSTTSLGCKHI